MKKQTTNKNVIRTCRICGQTLPTNKHSSAKTCGIPCYKKLVSIKYNIARNRLVSMTEVTEEEITAEIVKMWTKVCPTCGTPLGVCNRGRVYCSNKCRNKARLLARKVDK